MRYLFRAWRAKNPKRGLHMLRAYLQLLWPNGWEMTQMWQDHDAEYPTLSATDEGNHFLTSRVHVAISAGASDGSDVAAAAPAMRSVLAARFLLNVSIKQDTMVPLGIVCRAYAGARFQSFTGEFYRPPEELHIAQVAYQGAGVEQFSGSFT